MVHYRLYFFGDSGHFERAQDIDVADDAAAQQAARDLDHAFCIEIWRGKTKVGIVEPSTSRRLDPAGRRSAS